MNRTIKFRGKDIYTNEWIYGSLLTDNKDAFAILVPEIQESGKLKFKHKEVTHETVGQFTGLTDKNGKEIYEGDILSVCNGSINGCPWMDDPYPVEYQINKGFIMPMFLWDKDGRNCSDSTHWCEVIGNIHDNPDLLK